MPPTQPPEPLLARIARVVLIVSLIVIALAWLEYGWECATGLTYASRGRRGMISSPAHLEETEKRATSLSIVLVPLAFGCYLVSRRDR